MVWNPTIANLSLMALGSSAPEILLAIIEIIGNNFEAGDLGPGTIVGSAAFNMLMIISICMLITEVKHVEEIKVFYITVFFSVGAVVRAFAGGHSSVVALVVVLVVVWVLVSCILLYRWHLGGGEQRSALPLALALALAGVSSNLRNIQRSKRRNE